MNVDFRKIEVETNFDGTKELVDVSKELANLAKMKTCDIAFEDFCREIYYKGEVEVNEQQKQELIGIVNESKFYAFIKRGIINALNNE